MALHSDLPTRAQIGRLMTDRMSSSVSLYLPTGRLPDEGRAAQIEVKNLSCISARRAPGVRRGQAGRRTASGHCSATSPPTTNSGPSRRSAWLSSGAPRACGPSGSRTGCLLRSRCPTGSTSSRSCARAPSLTRDSYWHWPRAQCGCSSSDPTAPPTRSMSRTCRRCVGPERQQGGDGPGGHRRPPHRPGAASHSQRAGPATGAGRHRDDRRPVPDGQQLSRPGRRAQRRQPGDDLRR